MKATVWANYGADGVWMIEVDLLLGVDGYAMQGQTDLERYLAKVAALDVWVAAHAEQEGE